MKTTVLQWIGSLFIVLLLGSWLPLSAQNDESYITVSGVVKDAQTKKTLSYASVSIPGTNVGTVTNTDGEFSLKIKSSLAAKEVEISHLAYKNFRFSVAENETKKVILLVPHSRLLNEVTVRPDNPRKLIEDAIDKIGVNYSKEPNLFTGFYRETAQKGKRYIEIAEAIINIYKDSYSRSTGRDRVRIFKGRQLLSQKPSDTLAVKLLGGPTLAVLLDVVKNPDVLLDKDILAFYTYTLEDPVNINDRPQYVIAFQPNVTLPFALYYGKYYIDRETLAFSRVEFSLDMHDIDKATEMMLQKKPVGLRFKPSEFSFLITYKQQNGISYLNYLRCEAKFKCDWKRRLFSNKYDLISEMVTTEREVQPIQVIPYKESFKPDQAFSDKVSDFYDPDFWGAYNIIAPTESLDAAVVKLKKQR